MKIQRNKNRLIIDHDDHYTPIVKTATGHTRVTASFSLAEQSARSGERLERLVDLIRRCNHNGGSVGVSHRLATQIVYLAYWENYPLEFRIESEGDIVIRAFFPRQPELTVILDVFKRGTDPYFEIQRWWNFLCEMITAHADIWNIQLVVDESLQRDLMSGGFPRVLVNIVPEKESSKQPRTTVGVA